MRTKDGVISLSDLVRSSLRLRPDRIPIGEVRGPEALDLLKAWGTGHPGELAPSMRAPRSELCAGLSSSSRKPPTVPRALIAETIDVIAVLSGRGADRRLAELANVAGLGPSATTNSRQ